jgi:ankyrin repeat protein
MDGYNRTVDKDETNEEDQIKRGLGLPSRNTSSSETPLILAAKNGITEIVEVILKRYPQAIEHKNDRHENILHIAARYRRKEILDLLKY